MLSDSSSPIGPVHAMAISPGIAIGPVCLYKPASPVVEITKISPSQVEVEQQRLQMAIDAAILDLCKLSEHVAQTVGRSEADIFEAQQLMLQDPELLTETAELITQQHFSAATALHQAAEHQAQELESLENETLATRASDMRDVAARAIRHLQAEKTADQRSDGDGTPRLLVAHDLTPSDTATFDTRKILGICTVVGGPTTHAAIIARAMEIPAIAGLDPGLLDLLDDGQQIAIDGTKGLLYLQLDAGQQQELRTLMRQQQQERDLRRTQNEILWRDRPGSTADGIAVQIFANVGDLESARAAAELGAEGIGLFRTEFLFAGRQVFPNEQEQFDSYVAIFQAFAEHALLLQYPMTDRGNEGNQTSPPAAPSVGDSNRTPPNTSNVFALGKTIVARTLDAGADKPFPALEPLIGAMQEFNPALGLRGARIHLMHEELLRQQLRALLRAGAATSIQLHIMFPMIATLEEVRHLRTIYASVKHELESGGATLLPNTQIGIMVETPAAALMADVLVREVDFFSIGANDLFQYTMAADRTNSRVTSMFGMLEPAVWRLIDHVVRAGRAHGKMVALCGELAADPRIGPLLAGLGVQELSMSPPAIANVKAALHKQTIEYWQKRAQELLRAETASGMQAVLNTPT